jgi:hypothetical protein
MQGIIPMKRFFMAAVALYVFIYAYESFVHGVMLMPLYNETPTIWREYSQMKALIPYNLTIMVFFALWLTFIFTRLFKEGGMKNGMTFGVYFGMLAALQAAGTYFYLPVSLTLAGYWFAAYFIESILGGMIIGAIYSK